MGKKKKRTKRAGVKQQLLFEVLGFAMLALSIIALIQPGVVGTLFRGVFRFFAGSWDFMIPLFMLGVSIYIIWKRQWPTTWNHRVTGLVVVCIGILLYVHLSMMQAATNDGQFAERSVFAITWELYLEDVRSDGATQFLGGGMIGALLYAVLFWLFGYTGTMIIVFFIFAIGVLLITGRSYRDMAVGCVRLMKAIWNHLKKMAVDIRSVRPTNDGGNQRSNDGNGVSQVPTPMNETVSNRGVDQQTAAGAADDGPHGQDPVIHDFTEVAYNDNAAAKVHEPIAEGLEVDGSRVSDSAMVDSPVSTDDGFDNSGQVVAYAAESDYLLPAFSLLNKQKPSKQSGKKNIASNARKLEQTLESFGVGARVTQVHRGPTVTRYEVQPDIGVKVSRIVNLTDDIALSLAANGIRVEAPIPGKSAIGIEVPNDDVSLVTLREVLESAEFHEAESKISVVLGRDISGQPIVAALKSMPHLLVAGATGSGKSVCINGIICSILYKAKPHEVKFMMIDPKMVELNVYNGIPHLLTPVVTEPKKAALALKKVVAEMERRYELFSKNSTRDIESYNAYIQQENEQNTEKRPLLPYIVVIIDELADLMMVAAGDVEDAIGRLAQMARAAGIHLLIATQRPSVDVITGVIKANIPSRIAFGVSSQTDSRTILDMAGAEKLLGRGDMLYMPIGASKPMRIQGAFLSEKEVEQVVTYCKSQEQASYHEDMIPSESEEESTTEVTDNLYPEAVQFVVQHGSASVSMLQRRFRIGYNRAARMIDAMEDNGVVGPYEGSKPREVRISQVDDNSISS